VNSGALVRTGYSTRPGQGAPTPAPACPRPPWPRPPRPPRPRAPHFALPAPGPASPGPPAPPAPPCHGTALMSFFCQPTHVCRRPPRPAGPPPAPPGRPPTRLALPPPTPPPLCPPNPPAPPCHVTALINFFFLNPPTSATARPAQSCPCPARTAPANSLPPTRRPVLPYAPPRSSSSSAAVSGTSLGIQSRPRRLQSSSKTSSTGTQAMMLVASTTSRTAALPSCGTAHRCRRHS